MRFRLKTILIAILLSSLLYRPISTKAAGVGFVPSSRLWFSSLVFSQTESTVIYTVIINNNYFSLDAIVGFYVDEKIIDTAYVSNLSKEQAVQIKGNWQPTEGSHSIAVKFIKVTAFDANGQKTELNIKEFDTLNSANIIIGDNSPEENLPLNTSTTNINSPIAPALDIKVEKNGDKLVIVDIKPTVAISQSEQLKKTVEEKIQSAIQQGEETRNKIAAIFSSTSSTLHSANNVLTKTKTIIVNSGDYLNKEKIGQINLQAVLDKFKTIREMPIIKGKIIWLVGVVFFLLLIYFIKKIFKRRIE